MKKLIDMILERMKQGKGSVLVVIAENEGSAPRTVGAAMLVGQEGYLSGTIGGGMLEYKAVQEAQADLQAQKSAFRQYRLRKEEAAGLGMVCGGNVDVLFKVILPTEGHRQVLGKIQSCLNQKAKGWIAMSLSGEEIGFLDEKGEVFGLTREEVSAIHIKKEKRSFVTENQGGKKYYLSNLENASRVYIFGGGHLAQELVPVITHLGFRCVVTDDREEFSNKTLFPQAEEVHTRDFDKLEDNYDIHDQDYIIVMTRGHLRDLEVQKWALRTPACYIGSVGSKSKIAALNAKLREEGISEDDISRIVTPIGIKIHSETPAEIAISIAAQLIEKRAEYRSRK